MEAIGTLHVKTLEPLARHTTFRIGGPAEYFITARTQAELVQAAAWARNRRVLMFVLGGGSNLLISDAGIRGLVIENQCRAFEVKEQANGSAVLTTESGAPLPLIANLMGREGWSGLEWGIGIPGTIGGAIVGNAGAHGGAIADTLARVQVLDEFGEQRTLRNAELEFAYRTSNLKGTTRGIILSAEFELKREDPKACIARMNLYTEHRRRTQPTQASVGSIYKNPPGQFAGKLIEEAGLKGRRIGDAEISTVHANFIINHGTATSAQVLKLIALTKQTVFDRFGTRLELEIQVVGDHV